MRNRLWVLSISGLCAVTASCGGPSPETRANGGLALRLVTDTVFIVGASLSLDDFLGKVAAMGFDAQGNVHVLTPDAYRVTTWSDRGELLRRFGNRGEGPHEFRIPRYAFVRPSGEVMVMDIGHGALLVFDRDGDHIRNVRLPTSNGRPVPGASSVLTGGRFVGVDDYWLSRPSRTDPTIRRLYTFTLAGDSVRAKPYYDAWAPPPGLDLQMLPKVHVAPLPEGRVAVVDSVGYRVKILSDAGALDGVLERPFVPFPLTDAAMEAHRERKSKEVTERDITRASRDLAATTGLPLRDVDASDVYERYLASLADLEFADEIPVIHDVATDWDGRLWVTRASATGDAGPIDLFGPDGTYIGTITDVRVPDAFGPDGLIAYVNDHELDTQSVLVSRIVSIAPAMENHPPSTQGE